MNETTEGNAGNGVGTLQEDDQLQGMTNEQSSPALGMILAALQTMRDGDFSVRLPVLWTGLEGKIADTFNEIIAACRNSLRILNSP